VSEIEPVVVGVQETEDVDPVGELIVPTSVAPAKNSTLLTVAGETATAVADRVVDVPTTNEAPATGAVIATDGAVILTFTITEVALAPLESVTLAVSAVTPAAVGTQLKV
jgi:hypothetical protein